MPQLGGVVTCRKARGIRRLLLTSQVFWTNKRSRPPRLSHMRSNRAVGVQRPA
jgi:hypothetical protein